MPVSSLFVQGRELLTNMRNTKHFASLCAEIQDHAQARGLPWRIAQPDELMPFALEGATEDERREVGALALRLYFEQIYVRDFAVLDLRATAFRLDRSVGDIVWGPRPFFLRWQPDFLSALRKMYAGFYRADDVLFRQGVARLSLEPAAGVLLDYFGTGDQDAVRFRTAEYHASFHEVFVRCREEGLALHRNFIAFGIYLACLYDLLESLELPFDVRSAFEQAQPKGERAVRRDVYSGDRACL